MYEIERKFLVDTSILVLPKQYKTIKQGYVIADAKTAVRVRISNDKAFITIKSKTDRKHTVWEFEYEIPLDDANAMLNNLCGKFINKKRYIIPFEGNDWEVDVFEGDHAGLILAEIELESEHDQILLPAWITEEVSGNPKYYNVNMVN